MDGNIDTNNQTTNSYEKNILFAILATSCLLTHTACEDGKDEYLSDFSTILYFRNSGELPLTVYKTGEIQTTSLLLTSLVPL